VVPKVAGDTGGVVNAPNLFLRIVNKDGLRAALDAFLDAARAASGMHGAALRIAYPTVDGGGFSALICGKNGRAEQG